MELLAVSTLIAATLAASAPSPCADARAHEFDFWVGEWEVRRNDAEARVAGHNTIVRVDGCALLEHWRGASGSTGHSLNAFDSAHGVWRQFWVDDSGLVLRLEGGIENGAMVLRGAVGAAQQRISWTLRDDGSVRQLWESSSDGSAWKTEFDGIYRRASGGPAGAQPPAG